LSNLDTLSLYIINTKHFK